MCYTEDVLKENLLALLALLARGRVGGERMLYGILVIAVIVVVVLLVMQML